jgi:hypothetical protein
LLLGRAHLLEFGGSHDLSGHCSTLSLEQVSASRPAACRFRSTRSSNRSRDYRAQHLGRSVWLDSGRRAGYGVRVMGGSTDRPRSRCRLRADLSGGSLRTGASGADDCDTGRNSDDGTHADDQDDRRVLGVPFSGTEVVLPCGTLSDLTTLFCSASSDRWRTHRR